MSKYIDYKTTIWQRIHIPDDISNEDIIKALEKGLVDQTPWNVIADLTDSDNLLNEVLYDTDSCIEVKDNDGRSTVELFDNDETLWQNGVSIL